ncbi:MAG: HepT-like ribonuclease domain-containing protein [Phycisphaerales bacterium]
MPHDQSAGPGDRARCEHMLEAARDAIGFVAGRARADLDSDALLRRGLINAIQEIGEAAVRLSDAGRERVPGVPWPQVTRMRNILVHVYWGVDLDRVWDTATIDLPQLAASLESALSAWTESG